MFREEQTSPIYPSACALIVNARFQLCCRGCISYDGVGTLCLVDGNVTVQKYMNIDILDEHMWPVLARHFVNNFIQTKQLHSLYYLAGPIHRH